MAFSFLHPLVTALVLPTRVRDNLLSAEVNNLGTLGHSLLTARYFSVSPRALYS